MSEAGLGAPTQWSRVIAADAAITPLVPGDRTDRTSAPAGRRLTVVMVCHFGRTGYNILRALRMNGARVYLIHDDWATSLQLSTRLRVLHATKDLRTVEPNVVADTINELHQRVGVDCVIGSDVVALTLLGAIKQRLSAPLFPMCEPATLAMLDNKWKFHELCREHGVPDPDTLFFDSLHAVDAAAIAAGPRFPAVIKPVASYGQRGIAVLQDEAALQAFKQANAATFDGPAIIQQFVQGRDWAVSVFARDGRIEHWVSWLCPGQLDLTYGVGRFLATEFIARQDLFEMVGKLVAATGFTGVANFDARFDDNAGRMLMFECNPRFFNRMSAARLCGLDFVGPGLPIEKSQPFALTDTEYYPWQELLTTRGLKRLFRGELKLSRLARDLYEMATDPMPPLMRKLMREDRRA